MCCFIAWELSCVLGGFLVADWILQVDKALTGWLARERARIYKVDPRAMLLYSPKSEEGWLGSPQTTRGIMKVSTMRILHKCFTTLNKLSLSCGWG
eukprot:1730306-Amphidinium_carterae.1